MTSDVQRLRYRRPFGLEAVLARVTGPPPPARPRAEWLQLDVALHLKDAAVENNVARARIVGDVRLTGSNLHPGLVGAMEAGEGSQAFFRERPSTSPRARWTSNTGGAWRAGLRRARRVTRREYLIRLHAFGKTTQPQVLLSSEPSLPEGDVISLLTLGVTSRDRANSNTTTTGAGIAAEALYQASGLDRQVQKFLPRNSVIRDLSFHVSTLYNDANGLVEPTVQLESKFLTDQLKLGLSQPVSGKGTRALAEYRFDDRVSAQYPVGQRVQRRSDWKPGGRSQARGGTSSSPRAGAAPGRGAARAQGPATASQAPVVASVKLQMRGGGQAPSDLQGLVAVAPGRRCPPGRCAGVSSASSPPAASPTWWRAGTRVPTGWW